jgi:hypothetical protein
MEGQKKIDYYQWEDPTKTCDKEDTNNFFSILFFIIIFKRLVFN